MQGIRFEDDGMDKQSNVENALSIAIHSVCDSGKAMVGTMRKQMKSMKRIILALAISQI